MSKTSAQLDKEIRAAVRLGHGDTTTAGAERCNTCTRPVASPYRRFDHHGKVIEGRFDHHGKVIEGCVDAAHTGHLYGESLRWHMRPAAKDIRKKATERLRAMLTPRAPRS